MDDCRSLKESNEVTFAPGVLSPYFGRQTGGNIIYIYGDFPYAATGDYVRDGLVAHYDGINNTGQGDKYHSASTAAWKNLIKSEDEPDALPDGEMCLNYSCSTKGQDSNLDWTANSAYFAATNNAAWFKINKFYNPAYFTLEVAYSSNTAKHEAQNLIANWESGGFGFILGDRFGTQHAGLGTYINGKYEYTNGMYYELNEIQSLSSQYLDYGSSGCALAIYVNGAGNINPVQSSTCIRTNPQGNTVWAIGANPQGTYAQTVQFLQDGHIYSARIYNRALEPWEIKQNSDLDKIRYLDPPAVTIGGNPCTGVVVLSDHFLMCKVPPGSSEGPQDVEVNGVTYSGAYRYVHSTNDFYVSSISPIIGSAGTTLTLEGNRLGEISEVSVGAVSCTNVIYQDAVKYECELPPNSSREVDITIKLNDETVYRFAKVFEYQ
jgi:hypothetical protein